MVQTYLKGAENRFIFWFIYGYWCIC